MGRVDIGGDSTIGKRLHQEDAFMAYHVEEKLPAKSAQFRSERNRQVYMGVLCDGMGGEGDGDYCAREAVQAYAEAFAETGSFNTMWRQRMCMSLYSANAAIHYFKHSVGLLDNNSGCTLVSVVVSDDKLHFISVGDSYIWLFRKKDYREHEDEYECTLLNSLHTTFERTVTDEQGHTTTEYISYEDGMAERKQSLAPNVKLKQVGGPYCALIGNEIGYLSCSPVEGIRLRDGDIILFTSDGVYKGLGQNNMESVVQVFCAPNVTAQQLSEEIIRKIATLGRDSNQDNAACVVFKYHED